MSGWVILLVVLLSAAPSGAAPRTQLIGSAFDPATVSVALNSRSPKAAVTGEAAKRKPPDDAASFGFVLAAVRQAELYSSASQSSAAALILDDRLPPARASARAHPPRAPPAA